MQAGPPSPRRRCPAPVQGISGFATHAVSPSCTKPFIENRGRMHPAASGGCAFWPDRRRHDGPRHTLSTATVLSRHGLRAVSPATAHCGIDRPKTRMFISAPCSPTPPTSISCRPRPSVRRSAVPRSSYSSLLPSPQVRDELARKRITAKLRSEPRTGNGAGFRVSGPRKVTSDMNQTTSRFEKTRCSSTSGTTMPGACRGMRACPKASTRNASLIRQPATQRVAG